MSDIEEPPSKLTKFQVESQYFEEEVLEEGQEEWLSEGILTDDDYNTAAEQDGDGNTSQDETMASTNDNSIERLETSQENSETNDQDASQQSQDTTMHSEENIEETLNSFENSNNNNQMDLPDDLDTYLVRKTVVGVVRHSEDVGREEFDKESDIEGSTKHSDDDGNDTDDLLRVLGDGDDKGKMNDPSKEQQEASSDEDDDEYIFEGAKVQTLKVAAGALMMKYPAARAVPEDDDITDASSDEADTMKKMFSMQPAKAAKSTTPVQRPTVPSVQPASQPVVGQRKVIKTVIHVPHQPVSPKLTPLTSHRRVLVTSTNSVPKPEIPAVDRTRVKAPGVVKESKGGARALGLLEEHKTYSSQLKFAERTDVEPQRTYKQPQRTDKQPQRTDKQPQRTDKQPQRTDKQPQRTITQPQPKDKQPQVTDSQPQRTDQQPQRTDKQPQGTDSQPQRTDKQPQRTDKQPQRTEKQPQRTHINPQRTDMQPQRTNTQPQRTYMKPQRTDMQPQRTDKIEPQRIMRPERMDEEVPTDVDSDSDEESLYDELPSSDSDVMDDWFTLDIRAERAGDYLPLLGGKAHRLLTEEKGRVTERVATLKQSIAALADTGRSQAAELRQATVALAEIDAMLRAA